MASGGSLLHAGCGDNRAADAEDFGATTSHLEVSVKLAKAGWKVVGGI